MKKIALAFYCLSLIPFSDYAQQPIDSALLLQSYVFDNFSNGTVHSKSGEMNNGFLNYCAYDQSILFKQDGEIMTLTGLDAIDTIYFNNKKFVPFKDAVYEVIDTGKIPLLLSYTSKLHPWQATTDHKGTDVVSSNGVSNTVSSTYISRPYKGEFSIEITKSYWLKNNNKLYKAVTAHDFMKVFKEHANPSIDEYVKQNNINFNKESDLIKLVDFCNKQ